MANDTSAQCVRKQFLNYDEPPVVDVVAKGLGIRHVQACVMGVSSCIAYSLRTTLSVAIVAMVDYKNNGTNLTETASKLAPTYDWDEKTQGLVLSSFLWGYVLMQLPAGIITDRHGGHRFLCLAILGSSVLTLILPQCVYLGALIGAESTLVCLNRMCQGLIQAFAFPSMFALLGVWSPPSERGTLSGIALSGSLMGSVVATPISGFIAAEYGWPSIFYCFGLVGFITGLVAVFLGADAPVKHRFISQVEKHYILTSLGGAKVKRGIPWKKLLTSPPVLAAILTTAFLNMVFVTFFNKIPTYLATVLKYDMENNGILSALPYFVSWLLAFFFSWLCDCITDRGWLGLTTARKVFNSIGHFGSALCLVLMLYAKSSAMAVFLLTAFMGIQSAVFPGVQANFMDVAPNYSGTIFSLANFLSTFLGIIGLIGVGFIVTEAGSLEQWRIIFYLSAAILSLSNMVFVIWSTAETQPWNWAEKDEGHGIIYKPKKKVEIQL